MAKEDQELIDEEENIVEKSDSTKDDLGKELMQAIAFSHFAVMKYSTNEEIEHEEDFYKLFHPEKKPSNTKINKYKRYLSSTFDFDRIYNKWKSGRTEKTNEISIKTTVKIVYDVAKQFYLSNMISRNFNQYQFLDQTDDFMKLIKIDCLKKIISALHLSYKPDILSSADLYIVKKTEKNKIKIAFQKEILNKKDLYLINNFTKYNELLLHYWKNHQLFGVSLKLPQSNQTKHIKVVGNYNDIMNKKMKTKLDPFGKFLSLLSDPNTDIQKVINETIEIGNYNINDLSWHFPFTFKYKAIKLHPSDVNFILMAWPKAQSDGGGSAGFNGQFYNSPGYGTQWVGGTGIKTLEDFLSDYSEYGIILNELVNIRKKALNYALTGSISKKPNLKQEIDTKIDIKKIAGAGKDPKYTKAGKLSKYTHRKGVHGIYDYGEKGGLASYTMNVRNLQTLYSYALREVSEKQLNIGSSRNSKLVKFFEEYEKVTGNYDTLIKYKIAVQNLCKKINVATRLDKNSSEINTFYEHSQLSYFLLRGSSRIKNYLKKRMFLSIFGIITKKGYKTFPSTVTGIKGYLNSSTQIVNAIRAKVSKKLIQSIKEFDTIPHFYMS